IRVFSLIRMHRTENTVGWKRLGKLSTVSATPILNYRQTQVHTDILTCIHKTQTHKYPLSHTHTHIHMHTHPDQHTHWYTHTHVFMYAKMNAHIPRKMNTQHTTTPHTH